MNAKYFLSCIWGLALLCVGSVNLMAQSDTLTIDSNNREFGLLNEIITADTTETGERAHKVYRLKRNQTYILSGQIEHRDYHLNIVAEEGLGERPRIVPGVPPGGESGRPFRARGDLTLKGLYITGKDELGSLNADQRLVRISASGARVEADDCHFDHDGQSCFRTDSDNIKVFLTNSTVSNIGAPSNANNGRVLDDRGSNLDSVLFENNTFYNISSTLCNDRGGWIQYVKINQNTIVNIGQRIFDFNETQTGIFTNNVVVNAGFFGYDYDPREEGIVLMDLDTLTAESKADLPDVAQSFTYKNNNIYFDPALKEKYMSITESYTMDSLNYPGVNGDRVDAKALYDAGFEAFAGADNIATNIEEPLIFLASLSLDSTLAIIDDFYKDPNFGDDKTTVRDFHQPNDPDDFQYELDFRYEDVWASATASTSGGQLGDTNWQLKISGRSGLRASITEAEGLVAGAAIGGNIGEYPQAAIDALSAAITAANTVSEDFEASDDDIATALATIDSAIDTFLGGVITGIDDELANISKVLIYPNPSSNFIDFKDKDAVSYEIFNMSGALLDRDVINHEKPVSITSLQKGVYIMKVNMLDGVRRSLKLIKE